MRARLLLALPLAALVACTEAPLDTGVSGGVDVPERDPYLCGWEQNDPGDLVSTGAWEGDVIADFSAPDQCGEDYRIWDGYGRYTVLVSVPFW